MKHDIVAIESIPADRNAFQAMLNEARYRAKWQRRKRWIIAGLVAITLLLWLLIGTTTTAAIVFVVSTGYLIVKLRRARPARPARPGGAEDLQPGGAG